MAVPHPIDRRSRLRHRIHLAIDLVQEDGTILPAIMVNISESGLQFRCDTWIANEIEPRGIQTHNSCQMHIKVIAELNEQNKLYADARIISAQRLSQDTYLIGLEFIDFEYGSDTQLSNFLTTLE